MNYELDDDRNYGIRYVDTAELGLFELAGRILADLKADQGTGYLALPIVFVIKVVGNRITVMANLLPAELSGDYADAERTRARIRVVLSRYNFQGKSRADVRFDSEIKISHIRADRHDPLDIGALVG